MSGRFSPDGHIQFELDWSNLLGKALVPSRVLRDDLVMAAGGRHRNRSDVSARALLGLIGDWSASGGKLYQALARSLQDVIERGDLQPGALLPPARLLAQALNVSPTSPSTPMISRSLPHTARGVTCSPWARSASPRGAVSGSAG